MLEILKCEDKIIIKHKEAPYVYIVARPATEKENEVFTIEKTGECYKVVSGYGVYPTGTKTVEMSISDILFDETILCILKICSNKYAKEKLPFHMSSVAVLTETINEFIEKLKEV